MLSTLDLHLNFWPDPAFAFASSINKVLIFPKGGENSASLVFGCGFETGSSNKRQDLETIERAEIKSGKKKNKEIVVDGSRRIEVKFDVSYNEKLAIYAWSFNGYNDSSMIKYAKQYNFPRGCIVFWRKGKSIDLRCFYPKVCYLD